MISNSGELGNGQDWPLQPYIVIVRMAQPSRAADVLPSWTHGGAKKSVVEFEAS